jgi:DsbC/DsbD-like thiol-disulfide interchange protein
MRQARESQHTALAAGFACIILAGGAWPALAADASPWIEDLHSGARLIAGSSASGTTYLRAGIEIKMQPGWHTYWRYPGDSGVPPRFDFSRSDNLANATVSYPAPHLFTDETGNSLGYTGGAIFPLRVTARQKDKPVMLRVKIDYAVCEKLCVPVEASAELILAGGASEANETLTAAEARVPKKIPAADIGLTARRVNNAVKPLVMVDLTAPSDRSVNLFVEGPTAEWALPIPSPAQGAPTGHRHFSFELDGLPPGVDPKGHFDLTFTVVEDGKAREVKTHLD